MPLTQTPKPDIIIKRSKRAKSLRLSVSGPGQLTVTAPKLTPKWIVNRFIEAQQTWIDRQLTALENLPNWHTLEQAFATKKWHYLGKLYQIIQDPEQGRTPRFQQQNLYTSDNIAHFKKWAKSLATDLFEDRISQYQQQIGVTPSGLSVRNAKTRWGSCSSAGKIMLNLRLISAPIWVIDGIIVHELCHLIHMNHSSAFWQLVYQHYPDYDRIKAWTKDNRQLLFA